MSKKTFARCAAAAAAATGTLALVVPGAASATPAAASATPAAAVPAPKISAHVDGDVIDMTLTQTSASENVFCLPIVLNAADALPLAATPTDQWPGFGELVNKVYYIGNATSAAVATADSTTAAPEDGGINTGLLKPITPGAYAVVGACFDAADASQVLSYGYQVVFSPGGFGSLGQALDLGSATMSMDGGSSVIANMLLSGAGSSTLSAAIS